MTSREERRLKELLPKRKTQSKQLSLNENPNNVPFVTCARCSRRHPVDYHER